jgi:4-carboxymuconolactone decarboxylase
MTTPSSSQAPRSALAAVAPKLAELTTEVLFGDVWERPELSKRDRSLLVIAVLTALYRTDQLRGHIGRGLDNGLTRDEIAEIITHVAFYAGWPTAVNAANVAQEVFAQRGV